MQDPWKNFAIGSVAGLLGAVAMSMVMAVGKRLGFVHNPKPHRIEARIEEKTGTDDDVSPEQGVFLAQGIHMLIGTAYGAGYGLLLSLVNLPALIIGPVYGLGVYVINEIIAGPSLDLTPYPTREPKQTVWRRVFLHLLFGMVVGSIMQFSSKNFSTEFGESMRRREIRIG